MLQSRSLLAMAFIVLSLSGAGVAQSITTRSCGFSVELTPGWTMTRSANQEVNCWYAFENRKKRSCSILLRTLDSAFPFAAREAGFEQNGSDWVISETWGETIGADPITGTDWDGMKASHVSRETDATTGDVRGVTISVAVLSDRKASSAIIQSECGSDQFDAVVRSFRFIMRR